MFPDGAGTNNSSVDPNLLLSMMNNGGFGGNGNWMWIIFLFFLNGWGNNGFGNHNGTSYLASQSEREMLMQAINGNRNAIETLANRFNCDVNAINSAVNNVHNSIERVAGNIGLTGQQVINAIQQGNMQCT